MEGKKIPSDCQEGEIVTDKTGSRTKRATSIGGASDADHRSRNLDHSIDYFKDKS